ncbi:MAG: cytochrome c biogenesis protein CcdA [Candidatus Omnitrophota bacterium]|nr:cytochrome c biogenesis protein CcdA [Candidatus Omnitrophota bacterium]
MSEFPAGSLTLLGAFATGLALNLTPCVYPMLSVTLSLFSGMGEVKRTQAFLRALAYVLGIVTMYTALGVAAAYSGSLFGALLQNRWVLLTIGLFLFFLSLSLFGVYSFQVPNWILNRIFLKKTAGFAGLFLSGLLVGVFAAPCIGPPIVALLAYVATQQDPSVGFSTFFALSIGLGLPYLILGTFAGLITKLPKSGVWLVWVERLFGVMLFVLSAFYFLLAIQPDAVKHLAPVALIGGGFYLGFFERSAPAKGLFRRFQWGVGALAILVGVTLLDSGPRPAVVWTPYSNEVVEAAASERPVIMDFYAEWCIPCHELERWTYSDREVIAELERFTRVKVDLTYPESPRSVQVIEEYGIHGVPTILFLDRHGKEVTEARIDGFIGPEELLLVIRSPRFSE